MNTRVYAPGEHPDLPPPAGTTGAWAWVRKNLFSSISNSIMTLLIAYVLYLILPPMFHWLVTDSVVNAASQKECVAISPNGACWAFVLDRYDQFIYGLYPKEERWRPNVAFVLLILALIPLLWDKTPRRGLAMLGSCVYPFVAYWLLFGGFLGLEEVSTSKFGGVVLTLIIGVVGIFGSLPIGIVLALGRRSDMVFIRSICIAFIEFIRGVPLITLLFVASTMLNYFLPPGTEFDLLLRVLIMVTLFASGYMAEVIRGGLQAIPKGQFEAAEAMGLSYWKSMRLIVMPQALKISIPGIVNTFIGLFKDTTLVIIIGLLDVLGIGRAATSDPLWNGINREVYIFVAIFFWICCFFMSRYSLYLERKLHTGHKR